MTSAPQPSTATVRPRPASAPRWAAESTPRARPLTTVMPELARSAARCSATDRPYGDAARAPTIATDGVLKDAIPPRVHSTGGGSTIVVSATGYDASDHAIGAISCATARASASRAPARIVWTLSGWSGQRLSIICRRMAAGRSPARSRSATVDHVQLGTSDRATKSGRSVMPHLTLARNPDPNLYYSDARGQR